jgi:hypothetical protein
MDGQPFRWTGGAAGMTVKVNKPIMVIPLLASHPDIDENSVGVRIYTTENLFRTKKLLDEFELKENVWNERRYDFSGKIGSEFMLYFEVSRTWRPKEALDSPDPRSLGIAVGELRFEDTGIPLADMADPEWKSRLSRPGQVLFRLEPSEEEAEMGGKPPHVTEWRADVALPGGVFMLKLRAKGREAGKEWPLAGIWIDGRLVGEDWIKPGDRDGEAPSAESEVWNDYYYKVELDRGRHEIRVEFINAADIAQTREYRKLFLESLEIIEIKTSPADR